MSQSKQQLDEFAREARVFCSWATGDDRTEMSAANAVRRVSSLYVAALDLPSPFLPDQSVEVTNVEPPAGSLVAVGSRASKLALQVYWEIFDPSTDPPEPPVLGSIVDDLGDIYLDVARGLMLYDSGDRNEALWEWAFNFRIHWGRHASSALRALHEHIVQNDPDSLSVSKPNT